MISSVDENYCFKRSWCAALNQGVHSIWVSHWALDFLVSSYEKHRSIWELILIWLTELWIGIIAANMPTTVKNYH